MSGKEATIPALTVYSALQSGARFQPGFHIVAQSYLSLLCFVKILRQPEFWWFWPDFSVALWAF